MKYLALFKAIAILNEMHEEINDTAQKIVKDANVELDQLMDIQARKNDLGHPLILSCPSNAFSKIGDQVAYVPTHVLEMRLDNPLNHPDVEFGFITTLTDDGMDFFCRYWRKGQPGKLRTLGGSIRTPFYCLFLTQSVPQEIVDETLEELGYIVVKDEKA